MDKGLIIGIVSIFFIIIITVIIIVIVKNKKQEDPLSVQNETSTGQSDSIKVVKKSGILSKHPIIKTIGCKTKCATLHPFSKSKRTGCQEKCLPE
jgi:hypothetical protein